MWGVPILKMGVQFGTMGTLLSDGRIILKSPHGSYFFDEDGPVNFYHPHEDTFDALTAPETGETYDESPYARHPQTGKPVEGASHAIEALNQMVDMGLGSFMELRQGYFDMIFAMKNGVAPSTSSTTSSSSGDKFDTEGNIVPENEFPAPPVSDFDVRNRTHVPQGNKTTINLNMQGIALTQMEVTESVAEVIRRARNEGLDVG